ncbi:hypothetical protein M5K25_007620 [Dendrobium thyrsiflorum]|uniref:Reverse transcriptase zinc-binding domain-containing protein n=1 Tax=Dendrobium thyrsiflorum TaxID=117978 RepID=A0ABD0VFM7_DENTH
MNYYNDLTPCSWHNMIWHKKYVPRYSSFVWLCLVGGLKTTDALILINIQADPCCSLCHCSDESNSHIFFECSFSFSILVNIIPCASVLLLKPTILQLLAWINDHEDSIKNFIFLYVCCTIYYIWKERNERRFGNSMKSSSTIVLQIKRRRASSRKAGNQQKHHQDSCDRKENCARKEFPASGNRLKVLKPIGDASKVALPLVALQQKETESIGLLLGLGRLSTKNDLSKGRIGPLPTLSLVPSLTEKTNITFAFNPLDHLLNASLKRISDQLAILQASWASWVSQRAKAKLLSSGEDDLRFLYAKIRSRKNHNILKEIATPLSHFSSHPDIAAAIIQLFDVLFNSPKPLPTHLCLITKES